MADRVLLSRLTMFILHLWAAIETASTATKNRPDALDAHHSPKNSLTNFFKRTFDRPAFDDDKSGGSELGVDIKYDSYDSGVSEERRGGASGTADTRAFGLYNVSKAGDGTTPRQRRNDTINKHGDQITPKAVIYCTNSVEEIIINESNTLTSIDVKSYDNFTNVTDGYSNNSFLEENGMKKKGSYYDTRNDVGTSSWPCGGLPTMSSAWTSIIKDKALLCVVNQHWLEYDPPSHTSQLALAVVHVVVMVVGVVGNGLVIYLFISSRALRTPSNLLILNLAMGDFLLVAVLGVYVYNSLKEAPVAGKLGCDFYGFVSSLGGTASIMSLAAISFDRYLVIAYPLDPFKKFSYRQVLSIILVSWVYSGIFSVIPLLGIDGINFTPEGFLTTCSFDYLSEVMGTRVYIFSFFVAAWVLPLTIISFSYLSIVGTVSKQERHCYTCQGTFANSFKHQSIKRKKNVEVKLAKVASGIIGLWVVAWTPYAVVALLGIFSQKAIITPFVSMIPALFCKTAACLDPYVYALSHPRFKNELRKRMLLCRPKFLNGLRNVAAQGFSVSTFSEIREERELSDVQGWDTNDPSFSSLGPLLQKNVSYSSHPTVSDRRRSKASINSPGSKSLISPTGTEIYPRSTISTYSFRKTSRSFKDRRDTLEKSRKLDQMTELQTTVLIEFPRGGIPKAPFSHSCSFGNGVEELSKKHSQTPARVWRSSQLLKEDSTKAVCPNNNSTEEHYRDESDVPKLSEGNKVDYRSYLPITLLSIPPVSSACRLSMVRAKGRSNSLPNMTQSNGDKKEDGGKFPKNVLLQLFYGKLLYNGRKNKSHSSLYQDERRLGNV